MTKGLTTLAELGTAFKTGGMLGTGAHLLGAAKTMIVEMAQGVRAEAGGLKTMINDFRDAAALRGLVGDVGRIRFTGGEIRIPKNDIDFEIRWADEAYDAIRSTDDVADVARSAHAAGFTPEDIATIKNHLFMDSHQLDRYGETIVAPFDSNPRIAEAWVRLRDGAPHPADFDLLRHELHEAEIMRTAGSGYSSAHQSTLDAGFSWDSEAAVRDGFGYTGGR